MAPVLSVAEVVADQHLQARNTFMTAHHADKGEFRQLAPVLAGGERQQPVYQVKPAGETDTDVVLAAADFSGDEIAQLRSAGCVE